VLGGERDAFRHLVDRESRAVVRACYRILGDLHEAEDAAQEAFVTAYRSLATWRADGPFGAWLTRIAVRIALRMAGRRRSVAWIDPAERRAGRELSTPRWIARPPPRILPVGRWV
jgi:RNA polymerase sigma-70 factor (ECF subfamily)